MSHFSPIGVRLHWEKSRERRHVSIDKPPKKKKKTFGGRDNLVFLKALLIIKTLTRGKCIFSKISSTIK
jgi:hypothetical protein